ncbi:GNAT family N-acetyltransferase [Paractinoplanes lichenicola]|uniref:GNAT family N-acetyltransferase n=1 Tax=Paractinoplanes lichenicola TaxID=2802976 RepID=A0ABS1VQU4_9ACTN|nr:GNAT family N-acetyltransferase [Actinoplanes lichenicola]MBL7257096.1 GNAT family N-acetyltransferase [Actinoplanes lichenicola]
MSWQLTDDVDTFAATAGDFLRSRPIEHTTLLTVLATLQRRGPYAYGLAEPVFGWWSTPAAKVTAVLLQTPPHPMMFSELPPRAVPAAVLALNGRQLPGANLTADAVDGFAAGWRSRTGVRTQVVRRTRLYRLESLVFPAQPPPGHARYAGPDDRSLLQGWLLAFHDEIGERRPADPLAAIDDRLAYGGVLVWDDDGLPVAMAMTSRPEAGMVRVQIVYTPPVRRGRGYAGAVTVVAAQAALDSGARDVVLNTDLANPTSNALYQRLGFRPVEDRVIVEFTR